MLVLFFLQLLGDSPHCITSGSVSLRSSPKLVQLQYLSYSFQELSLGHGSCSPHHPVTAAPRQLEAQAEVARHFPVTLEWEGEGITSWHLLGRDKGVGKAVALCCCCTGNKE